MNLCNGQKVETRIFKAETYYFENMILNLAVHLNI